MRQLPLLHEIFATAYGTERLWVSLDFPLYKPPHRADARPDDYDALPIHWDVDPRERHLFQGMVYLTDSPQERGAFRCVPALLHDCAGWFERHPNGDLSHVDCEGHDVRSVPCLAGDLLLWDSRLPHGNGRNADSCPRVTQAIAMQPPGFWGESARRPDQALENGKGEPLLRR